MSKILQRFLFLLMVFAFTNSAYAEDANNEISYRSAEVGRESIRLASDGTGIIEDFSCIGCGFKVLNVGSDAVGYLGDELINVADLVKQSKANVGVVRYAKNSNRVYEIRFSH